MHLHWDLYAFTWTHPQTNPQSRCSRASTFPPHPGFYVFTLFILQETAWLSVCARQVRGSILLNFVALWPTCVMLSCYVSSPVVFAWLPLRTRRGPRGLPSPRIFMVLGGMEAAFVRSPSPGPWRARRLCSVDVDSRVWLA